MTNLRASGPMLADRPSRAATVIPPLSFSLLFYSYPTPGRAGFTAPCRHTSTWAGGGGHFLPAAAVRTSTSCIHLLISAGRGGRPLHLGLWLTRPHSPATHTPAHLSSGIFSQSHSKWRQATPTSLSHICLFLLSLLPHHPINSSLSRTILWKRQALHMHTSSLYTGDRQATGHSLGR